jgi:predicted thioesterase
MKPSEEEVKAANAVFDTALNVYLRQTATYKYAMLVYMGTVGIENAQPKLDEALTKIGHVEISIIEPLIKEARRQLS